MKSFFNTGAEYRRFMAFQKSLHEPVPESLWTRYEIYVNCVHDIEGTKHVKTFKEWVTS